jgi:plasmid maintenance system antidote protein VapI
MAGGVANGMTPAPMMALAELSGVSDRTIHRIRHENKKVRIDIADKLAVALDVPSALIWSDRW